MMCPTSMGVFLYRKPLISKLKGNLGHRHPTVHPAVYPSASRPAETRVWKHIHFHREDSSFMEEGRTSTCGWALDGWVAVLSQRPLVTLPQAGQGQPWISGQVKIKEKKNFSQPLYKFRTRSIMCPLAKGNTKRLKDGLCFTWVFILFPNLLVSLVKTQPENCPWCKSKSCHWGLLEEVLFEEIC